MRLCCQILDAKPHRKSQIASIAPSASLYTRRFFFRSMQHTGLGSGLRGPPASTCILNREAGAATNSQIHGLGQRTATSLLGLVFEGHRTRNCGGPRTDDGEVGEGPVSLELLERVVELDKVGELERVRRRSTLHRSCSFSAKGFQKKKVLGFPFLQIVNFCMFDTESHNPGLS
jgi:hypothetical protein